MSFNGAGPALQGDIEIVEIEDDDDENPMIVMQIASKKPEESTCLNDYTKPSSTLHRSRIKAFNGYTRPSYTFPQLITKALAACPGRRETALKICDLIADMQPYYKHHTGNWQASVYKSLTRNTKIFAICDKNDSGEFIWSFNHNFEKYMLDKWLPKYLQKKDKVVTSTETIVGPEISISPETVNSSNAQSSLLECLDIGNVSSSSSASFPDFVLADPDQLEDYQPDEINQIRNPLEPEGTILDDELAVIIGNTETSLTDPDWPPSLNGFTKPSYTFAQLIAKALALFPDRRATAQKVCDLIADMEPYFKHHTGNWKESLNTYFFTNKNLFAVHQTNENNEYIWGLNPNFEKYLINNWLPKYLQSKEKSITPTDPIGEFEILTSLPTVNLSNKDGSKIDNPDILRKSSHPLSNSISKSLIADSMQQPVPEGVQPVNRVTSSCQNFPSHYRDLNQLISKPGAEPLHDSGISSSASVQDIVFANSDQLENQQPDEIHQNRNPLESEVTVSETESLLDFETLSAVSSITKSAENKDILQYPTQIFSTEFSLNNLNHPHNMEFCNEEMRYRAQFKKMHPSVEKFRIHCTVCDTHLGTAGLMAQENVRFHANLGVLTCKMCYDNTKHISEIGTQNVCLWCNITEGIHFFCLTCPFKFCQTCIDKNFGVPWRINMTQNNNWQCFLCDKKQLWPHRAVSYFLLCHYEELKRKKNLLNGGRVKYKNSVPPFFLKDLSSCCKKTVVPNMSMKVKDFEHKSLTTSNSAASATSESAPPKPFLAHSTSFSNPSKTLNPVSNTAFEYSPNQTDNQRMVIIENPSENHVVVQTATCISSVTVNTGTQYIHNIYPDKNCIYGQSATTNTQCTSANRIVSHEISRSDLNHSLMQSNFMSVNDPNLQTIHSHSTSGNTVTVDNTNATPICIEPFSSNQATDLFKLEEKLKNKPMPKSRKQSLLRTVLMDGSIESINKHLQLNNVNTSNPCTESPVTYKKNDDFCFNTNNNIASSWSDQYTEEPILKSIIQTATERLLSLNKNPVSFDETINNNQQSLQKNINCDLGEIRNMYSNSNQETLKNGLPKIKVRAVEDLQEHRPNILNSDNELTGLNESDNILKVHNMDSKETPSETNVTELKQSIIEASRTLVSTQKKFKELAKNISNKLTFPTANAAEMVTTFQDILKLCQKQIDVIDNNITRQYYHILLHSKKSSESVGVPTSEVKSQLKALHLQNKKKPIKPPKIHFSRVVSVPVKDIEEDDVVENATTSNNSNHMTSHQQINKLSKRKHENKMMDEISVKRKRDSVDFNPLNKKDILGTPEITEEEVKQFGTTGEENSNQVNKSLLTKELVQRQLYTRKIKKKKDVWSYKSRKRVYNKNNFKQRKIKRSILNTWNKTENDWDYEPKMPSKYKEERLRVRKMNSCRPLRSSERKHPSSAAIAASTDSIHGNGSGVVAHLPVGCVIKPCSVLVHKLDIRIVELMLEKRFRKL